MWENLFDLLQSQPKIRSHMTLKTDKKGITHFNIDHYYCITTHANMCTFSSLSAFAVSNFFLFRCSCCCFDCYYCYCCCFFIIIQHILWRYWFTFSRVVFSFYNFSMAFIVYIRKKHSQKKNTTQSG